MTTPINHSALNAWASQPASLGMPDPLPDLSRSRGIYSINCPDTPYIMMSDAATPARAPSAN